MTEEQQERELQRRFANFEPNLVARYYSDPTLCRCQDKHWAAKRGAMESQAADRWPNTNLTAAQPSCDSAVPKNSETLGSEYDPNDPGIGSENDHYGLKSLYSKQDKKGKPAVSFKTGSSCGQGPSKDNKDSGGDGSESPSYSRLFASPQRKPCVYDSPCSDAHRYEAPGQQLIPP